MGMFDSNQGSGGSGISGAGLPFGAMQKFANGASMFDGFNNFMNSDTFNNFSKLGSLGLGVFGLKQGIDFQNDQLGILKDQENRAATAQNLQTGNSLSLALQTTTPGTPEHERIKQAIADGSFAV